MLEYFKQLLKQECPEYLIVLYTCSGKELSAVTAKWVKSGKAYMALAFYTDAWISKNPAGPDNNIVLTERRTLRDIANITEFLTVEECKQAKIISGDDISALVSKMQRQILSGLAQVVDVYDSFTYKFVVSPYPMLIVTVVDEGGLVGTFSITPNGATNIIMVGDSSIYDYANNIKEVMLPSITAGRNVKLLELT